MPYIPGSYGQAFPPSGDLAMGTHKITGLGDPTNDQDAATKAYVTAHGTDSSKLPLAGGTMSGAINMGSHKITNLDDPVADTDAVNVEYVQTVVGGPAIHQTSHGFSIGQAVRVDSVTGLWTKSEADTDDHSVVAGIVSAVLGPSLFRLATDGQRMTGLSDLTPGEIYVLSQTVAGALVSTTYTSGIIAPVLLATSATTGIVRITRPSNGSASSGVTSLAKSGSTPQTGAVTLSEGSGISITQTNGNLAIAATGGGFNSITQTVLLYPNTPGSGNFLVSTVGTWGAYTDPHCMTGGYIGNNSSVSNGDALSIGPVSVAETGTYVAYLGAAYDGGRPKLDLSVNGGAALGTFNMGPGGGSYALLGPVSLGTLTAGTAYTFQLTLNGKDQVGYSNQATLSSLVLVRTA